jgi:hypothetical protein
VGTRAGVNKSNKSLYARGNGDKARQAMHGDGESPQDFLLLPGSRLNAQISRETTPFSVNASHFALQADKRFKNRPYYGVYGIAQGVSTRLCNAVLVELCLESPPSGLPAVFGYTPSTHGTGQTNAFKGTTYGRGGPPRDIPKTDL